MHVFGIFLGILTGLGLALYLTSLLIKRSNDVGDSIGQLSDFGSLHMIHSEPKLSSGRKYDKDLSQSMSQTLLRESYERKVASYENALGQPTVKEEKAQPPMHWPE
ncbi:MAG: hypothetical protein IK125_02550 [Lachnospiraceae bacterium]|nr:hypothetical protein [Lachnospiraceae bacterium]